LHHAACGGFVFATKIIAHHFNAEVAPSFHDDLNRFHMGAGHDHDVGGAGLGHHFGFKITPVHCFEIGNDGMVGKCRAQGAYTVQALGQNERSARFEPVDAGLDGDAGGVQGFLNINKVERDLNCGWVRARQLSVLMDEARSLMRWHAS
jgi:hypothetical protein